MNVNLATAHRDPGIALQEKIYAEIESTSLKRAGQSQVVAGDEAPSTDVDGVQNNVLTDDLVGELSENSDAYKTPESVQTHARCLIGLLNYDPKENEIFSAEATSWKSILDLEPVAAFSKIEAVLMSKFAKDTAEVAEPDTHLKKDLEGVFEKRSWGKLKNGSASRKVAYSLYAKLVSLRGIFYNKYLSESSKASNLNEVTSTEVSHYSEITNAMQVFLSKWSYQDARILDNAGRLAGDFTNRVAVIGVNQRGENVQVPWGDAFPEETKSLAEAHEKVVTALKAQKEQCEDDALEPAFDAKIEFYQLMADAWSDPTPENFRKVAASIGKQTGSVFGQAVYMPLIETCFSEDKLSIYPDACLELVDPQHLEGNRKIEEARQIIIDAVNKIFDEIEAELKDEAEKKALRKQRDLTIKFIREATASARHPINAGGREMAGYGGQVAPGKIQDRLEGGVDIFLDQTPSIVANRVKAFSAVFKLICGRGAMDGTWEKVKDGRHTAAHEFVHLVGLTEDLLERVEESFLKGFIEEFKAYGGALLVESFVPLKAKLDSGEEPTTEMYDEFRRDIERTFGFVLQLRRAYGPYRSLDKDARFGVVLINQLAEAGLLTIKKGEAKCDLDLADCEKLMSFGNKFLEMLKKLIKLYLNGKEKDFRTFIRELLRPRREAKRIIELVDNNKLYTGGSEASLKELCIVPQQPGLNPWKRSIAFVQELFNRSAFSLKLKVRL